MSPASARLAIDTLPRPVDATVVVPGSKSHTNRALVCAAMADGASILRRILLADDTEAMLGILDDLGVGTDLDRSGPTVSIDGVGGRIPVGGARLDARQSGTTSRFVLPLLALGDGRFVLDGHEQMRARPFDDLVNALHDLGGRVEGTTLPLTVHGSGRLSGGRVSVPGSVSSQFLSALLLAAPLADTETVISVDGDLVSRPYVDLTLHTMASFGVDVADDGAGGLVVPPCGYRGADVTIEPDASAASYFFAAAAVTGSRVRIEGLGSASVQGDVAFVDVLEAMGAEVTRSADAIEVRGTGELRGIEVDMADISDTAPTLAAIAPLADGPVRITGIDFIRRKETDRIAAPVAELRRLGVDATEDDDGLTVHPGSVRPGVVRTYDDHRMAMSFAVLGLVAPGIEIADPGCVAKTFPDFFDVLEGLRS